MSLQVQTQSKSGVATPNPGRKPAVKPAPLRTTTPTDRAGVSKEAREPETKSRVNLGALNTERPEAKTPEEKVKTVRKVFMRPRNYKARIQALEQELAQARTKGDQAKIRELEAKIKEMKSPVQVRDVPVDSKVSAKAEATAAKRGQPTAGGGAAPAAPGGFGGGGGGGTPAAPGGFGGGGGGGTAAAPGGFGGGGGAPAASGEFGATPATGQGAGKPEVNQFIQFAAQAYGVDPKVLSEIARLESNFNTGDIANNWDSNARKGTPSKGMFQFIEPTARDMMPKAKAANPGAWQGVSMNWTDWKAQALTTAWAIKNGKGSHWSTFNRAKAAAGRG